MAEDNEGEIDTQGSEARRLSQQRDVGLEHSTWAKCHTRVGIL